MPPEKLLPSAEVNGRDTSEPNHLYSLPMHCLVKVRYGQLAVPCTVRVHSRSQLCITNTAKTDYIYDNGIDTSYGDNTDGQNGAISGLRSLLSLRSSERERGFGFSTDRGEAESGYWLHIEFKQPQRALVAGQTLVLYDGQVCLGGGIL